MSLTITCLEAPVCEDTYDSLWVRIQHGDGLVERVDVVYSGKKLKTGEPIQSSPITLPQAIRMHSIRYGRRAPRLGFGGNEDGGRLIVDFVNGIAYWAEGVTETSLVKEVRYLPKADPLIRNALPLTGHGSWLIMAGWSEPRYKNALEEGVPAKEPSRSGEEISRQEIAQRLQTMSSEVRAFSQTTLMLSGRIFVSLEKNEPPDPEVASKLRKTFALLTETTNEAMGWINDHPHAVTAENAGALPIDLAGEAEARMSELVAEGFAQ